MIPRWRHHVLAHEKKSGKRLTSLRRFLNLHTKLNLKAGAMTRHQREAKGRKHRSGRRTAVDDRAGRLATGVKGVQRRRALIAEDWKTRPGDAGFNNEAAAKMRARGPAGNKKNFYLKCTDPPTDQAYQRTVPWLLSDRSPVERLLVVHRTGSGKTVSMIRTLDKMFNDKRSKILIFPTRTTVKNFYSELIKFPSKYRRAFLKAKGWKRVPSDFNIGDSETLLEVQNFFGKHKYPNRTGGGRTRYQRAMFSLKAPLRAFTYTVVGGSGVNNAIFNRPRSNNPFNSRIILMDEIHNLVQPPKHYNRVQKKNLNTLKTWLTACTGSAVVGFTATPVVKAPTDDGWGEDGDTIMDIIKGEQNRGKNNEGFVSYFNSMPGNIYPSTIPCDVKNIEEAVEWVDLEGPNALKYAEMEKKFIKKYTGTNLLFKLQLYCNTSFYHNRFAQQSKGLSKANAKMYSNKFHDIAQYVAQAEGKTLILVHRTQGFKVMRELMNNVINKECGRPNGQGCNAGDMGWVGVLDVPKKNQSSPLAEFNHPDNIRGESMKALLVDAKFFSEGVNFLGVRHLILVNPPLTYASYKQRIGRALRMCSYEGLPANKRDVTIKMYVARYKNGVPPPKKKKTKPGRPKKPPQSMKPEAEWTGSYLRSLTQAQLRGGPKSPCRKVKKKFKEKTKTEDNPKGITCSKFKKKEHLNTLIKLLVEQGTIGPEQANRLGGGSNGKTGSIFNDVDAINIPFEIIGSSPSAAEPRARARTADEEVLAMLIKEKDKIELAMAEFEQVAVDREVLDPLIAKTCKKPKPKRRARFGCDTNDDCPENFECNENICIRTHEYTPLRRTASDSIGFDSGSSLDDARHPRRVRVLDNFDPREYGITTNAGNNEHEKFNKDNTWAYRRHDEEEDEKFENFNKDNTWASSSSSSSSNSSSSSTNSTTNPNGDPRPPPLRRTDSMSFDSIDDSGSGDWLLGNNDQPHFVAGGKKKKFPLSYPVEIY